MFDSDSRWEDRLRNVPAPPDLQARLRAIALRDLLNSDDACDDQLRAVAVPEGLAASISRGLFIEDDWLDAVVTDVPTPAGLEGRIVCSVICDDDEALDEGLRLTPPMERRILPPLGPRMVAAAFRYATVTVLFVAFLGALSGSLLARLAQIGPVARFDSLAMLLVEQDDGPMPFDSLESSAEGPFAIAAFASEIAASEGEIGLPDAVAGRPSSAFDEMELLLARWRTGEGVDPWLSTIAPMWEQQVVAYREIDALPELEKLSPPMPMGMQPPLVAAFPFRELRETGFFPWVVPGSHPLLQTWHVPLVHAVDSYGLTRRYAAGGELPPPELVRTEEFLAAMDYGLPMPTRGELRLSAAAGPSPFAGEGYWLLLLGVQAQSPLLLQHPPKHLIVVFDTSGSMNWGGRAEMARRALDRLFRMIAWEDRISLITFSEKATVQFSGATRDEADAMSSLLAKIPVEGPTNLAAAVASSLRLAAAEQASAEQNETREQIVLLLTDGAVEMDRATGEQMEQMLRKAGDSGVKLNVIDLSQGSDEDRQLRRLAQAGRGRALRAVSPAQIDWSLAEVVSDRPQRLAEDVRLSVTFNPTAVRAYRFFGHEPSALRRISDSQGLARVDFHAGQSAVALFELQLFGNDQTVASAELSWQTVGGGSRREQAISIRQRDFPPTLAQTAPSLQAAALAARTAEVLRTPRPPRTRPMAELLAVAKQFDQSLIYRPGYVELLRLIEECDRARPAKTRR